MCGSCSFFRGFLGAVVCGAIVIPVLVLGGGVLQAQVSSGGGKFNACCPQPG